MRIENKAVVWCSTLLMSVLWIGACGGDAPEGEDDDGSGGSGASSSSGGSDGDSGGMSGDGDTGGMPGDGDGDGDGDTGGMPGDGDGDGDTGGMPGSGGMDGSGGDMGTGGAMGGMGGVPVESELEADCQTRCETIVSIACPENTDQAQCESDCLAGSASGCETEYEDQIACEATLSSSGYMCLSFGPYNSVGLSGEGYSTCATEVDVYEACAF